METREYTHFKISPETKDKGNFILLSINKVWIGRGLNNEHEEVIEFSKRFSDKSEVESFKETKLYLLVLDAVKKGV